MKIEANWEEWNNTHPVCLNIEYPYAEDMLIELSDLLNYARSFDVGQTLVIARLIDALEAAIGQKPVGETDGHSDEA